MDLNSLVGLFDSTYHPDVNVRNNAEAQLKQFEANDGFLSTILQIIGADELSTGTKQAAAIYFKNRVSRAWSASQHALDNHAPISESDRAAAKENILKFIYATPHTIKVQLTSCLGVILNFDYPDKWAQFDGQLKELLSAQDPQMVYTGLLALRELVRLYRYSQTKRTVIDAVARDLFPRVQAVVDDAIGSDDELAMRMVWAAFKTYYAAIQVALPVALQEPGSLVAWGTSFIKMMEKPVAFDRSLVDEDTAKEPVWKAKKWAFRSVNRLYSRFGNPATLAPSQKRYKTFAKVFTANFLPQIMQAYFKQIDGYVQGTVWMSSRIRGLVSQMIAECVKEKAAWKLVKPHVESIVSQYIFPQMCFSEDDKELWEDNPVEYVQKKIDPLDDFGSSTVAASNLLIDFAVDRKSATLSIILNFVNSIITQYSQASEETRNPQLIDGALNMMGALCGPLCSRKSPIYSTLPDFLLTNVIPLFKSKYGFVRARALDVYCRYSSIEFSDKQVQQGVFEGVYGLLSDPELPVRVHAALALQPMIENEDIRGLLQSHLPQVMQVFLNLTNEIDSDTITHVIEEFVEIFADQMAPFAVQLAQQLCDTFMRIMGDITVNTPDISTVDIDDISDKTMAAMGVLKTLGTLVLNLESSADVVFKLEEVIFPIVRFVLDQRLVDLYDEVYEILDCCTFAVKTISPNAWSLFDVIYTTFKNDSSDFIEEMLPSLDNFVSYGMDVVSTNSEVQSRLFDIIETVMKSERAGESERICACKLAEAIMLNGRGKVDGMIPGLISLAAAYLLVNDAIQTRGFLVYTLEVILNALYYNPVITLSVLEQFQWTSGIFTRLVQSIDKFTRVNDKKLVVLGLTSLLSVPADQLPASLQAGLPQVFEGILQTFHTLGEAVEARDALERMYDGTGDDFDGDYEWDGVQDELVDDDLAEDDADELQQEYLRQLAGRAGEALGEGAEGEFDDDDEDDYDEALEEELAFESPLDAVKPHVWLQDKLAEMQSSNPATYNVIVQSLNPEKSQFLQTLMDEAIKQRSEQQ